MSNEPQEYGTDWYDTEPPPMKEPVQHLSLQVLHDNDATVAKVRYFRNFNGHDTEIEATGSAKRERGDSDNRELGDALATARALEKLAARMHRKARGMIHEADNRKKAKPSGIKGIDLSDAAHLDGMGSVGAIPWSPWNKPSDYGWTLTAVGGGPDLLDVEQGQILHDEVLNQSVKVTPAPLTPNELIDIYYRAVRDDTADQVIAGEVTGVDIDWDKKEISDYPSTEVGVELKGGRGTATVDANGTVTLYNRDGKIIGSFQI